MSAFEAPPVRSSDLSKRDSVSRSQASVGWTSGAEVFGYGGQGQIGLRVGPKLDDFGVFAEVTVYTGAFGDVGSIGRSGTGLSGVTNGLTVCGGKGPVTTEAFVTSEKAELSLGPFSSNMDSQAPEVCATWPASFRAAGIRYGRSVRTEVTLRSLSEMAAESQFVRDLLDPRSYFPDIEGSDHSRQRENGGTQRSGGGHGGADDLP